MGHPVDAHIIQFVFPIKSLLSLDLTGSYIPGSYIEILSNNFKLENLKLGVCVMDIQELVQLLGHLKRLQKITVRRFAYLNDDEINSAKNNHPCLRKVIFGSR